MGRTHGQISCCGCLIGVSKNQYACIRLINPAILLLEKEFDNIKGMIFDSGFPHI